MNSTNHDDDGVSELLKLGTSMIGCHLRSITSAVPLLWASGNAMREQFFKKNIYSTFPDGRTVIRHANLYAYVLFNTAISYERRINGIFSLNF